MAKVTAEESAYQETTQALRYALEDTSLTVKQKDDIANVFETMDAYSGNANDFANAAIGIIERVRDDVPELLSQTLMALAHAADWYKLYW